MGTLDVIVKVGDDLRQDRLVLNIFQIAQKEWKQKELNIPLTLYSVLPTGKSEGLIEVVPNAITTASIAKSSTGKAIFSGETDLMSQAIQIFQVWFPHRPWGHKRLFEVSSSRLAIK